MCDLHQPAAETSAASPSYSLNVDDYVVFNEITYLGSSIVNAPKSEVEINRNMAVLNCQSEYSISIILFIPKDFYGVVRLADSQLNLDISTYKIQQILFCARGPSLGSEQSCFAFTCSHGDTVESAIFQCHVFRIEKHDAVFTVDKILKSFHQAFQKVLPVNQQLPPQSLNESSHNFIISSELIEEDKKGNSISCSHENSIIKMHKNLNKKIVITITQTGEKDLLLIQRCFGLLIAPGRNIKNDSLHFLNVISMETIAGNSYQITATWDVSDSVFDILNTETPKDKFIYITICTDLVIKNIKEPVRFLIEAKATISSNLDMENSPNKKPFFDEFLLKLKKNTTNESATNNFNYEVLDIVKKDICDDAHFLSLQESLSNQSLDCESDNDEPLLSGSGTVSKEVTDETQLNSWHQLLKCWHQNLTQRPRGLISLVRSGIPEALRGEVWQLLAGCQNTNELLEAYRVLTNKESACEEVIVRDINRTFPAHEFFKEAGGLGQESLLKICKAYSVYDKEVGYCQGLSFLAAALLLHMPEEQAFAVLVKIMFDYELRNLFKHGFVELQQKFYQMERFLQDSMSDLWEHFCQINLETHMYASQWFLTLFTAKFPLHLVFLILDYYLAEGKFTIFNVAVALLKTNKKDLLNFDFEETLKFFRVTLPKKYRSLQLSRELLLQSYEIKINQKKLKKYEKDYLVLKEQERKEGDPLEILKRENKQLIENNLRLEQENDNLASELVSTKITYRTKLDEIEDKCEILNKELLKTKTVLLEAEEERKRLLAESDQVKEMCRREVEKTANENIRNSTIIADYKQICTQMSERIDKQQKSHSEFVQEIELQLQSCSSCVKLLGPDGLIRKSNSETTENSTPLKGSNGSSERDIELELAQTKLALVEAECKIQDLTHQLNSSFSEIETLKEGWFKKTIVSLTKKDSKPESKDKN